MNESTQRFRTFEDLEVYQVAREFRTAMYGVTRRLPAIEKFELASQIRRAAVSLTNNIAEGHGQKAGASLGVHESPAAYGFTDDELDVLLNAQLGSRFNASTV